VDTDMMADVAFREILGDPEFAFDADGFAPIRIADRLDGLIRRREDQSVAEVWFRVAESDDVGEVVLRELLVLNNGRRRDGDPVFSIDPTTSLLVAAITLELDRTTIAEAARALERAFQACDAVQQIIANGDTAPAAHGPAPLQAPASTDFV
jgi:hypothetical protein